MPVENPLINGGRMRGQPRTVRTQRDADPELDMLDFDMSSRTPMHVAILVTGALAVIVGLNMAGFRFVFASSVGFGR